MTCLDLSPLPSPRLEEGSRWRGADGGSFVDDAVVMALVAGPVGSREFPWPLLAADEMDFAGWDLSVAPLAGTVAGGAIRAAETTRRASPPVLDEAAWGAPRRAGHRWWLAGLAGVASTLLFLLLLFSLAARQPLSNGLEMISNPPVAPVPGVSVPARPADGSGGGDSQLTAILPAGEKFPSSDERAR